MSTNQNTINKFYSAFQQLDAETMKSCYHEEAIFSDPVFGLLDAEHTTSMWKMLCKNAKDFQLQYHTIELLDEEYATCQWDCSYQFSATGKKVNNRIKAYMKFNDGLIIEHSDAFDFYKWTRMAFGIKGLLFGWTNFMQKRIQEKARKNLIRFMGY